ncbi:MAG: hypothetical protein VX335_05215 [Pseudomonadota bacterium]|nr:hypothetical protein [Pseudomonadota bacterium]
MNFQPLASNFAYYSMKFFITDLLTRFFISVFPVFLILPPAGSYFAILIISGFSSFLYSTFISGNIKESSYNCLFNTLMFTVLFFIAIAFGLIAFNPLSVISFSALNIAILSSCIIEFLLEIKNIYFKRETTEIVMPPVIDINPVSSDLVFDHIQNQVDLCPNYMRIAIDDNKVGHNIFPKDLDMEIFEKNSYIDEYQRLDHHTYMSHSNFLTS